MPRGSILTQKVETIIKETYLNYPELRAKPKKFYEQVYSQVHQDWLAESNWPGLSAVKKRLLKLRREDENRSPGSKELDKPWSIGSLSKYDVPSEVVPILLELKEYLSKQGQSLTIREARWVSKLIPLIQTKVLPRMEALSQWSYRYAFQERISELSGMDLLDLDTSALDKIIKDFAEEWAAYPSLWDALEIQEGFAFTAGLCQYLIELRYVAKQRELTKQEKTMLSYAEQSERELAIVFTEIQFLDDPEEAIKADQMVDRIIGAGESVTIKSAQRILGKKNANWLMSCLQKGAERALEYFEIQKKEAKNE